MNLETIKRSMQREWRIDCADGARFVLPAP